MNYFSVLPRYISRSFLLHFVFLLLILLFIVYIFDFIELLNRGADHNASFTDLMVLGLYKLPEVGQVILPFAVLFSAMFTFWRLNKTSELTVMRAMGTSALQFTLPMVFTALCLGIFVTAAVNPLSAVLLKKYEQQQNILFEKTSKLVSISENGLWLRQNTNNGYALLNAKALNAENWTINDLTILEMSQDNKLIQRIQADFGHLEDQQWTLENVSVFTKGPRPRRQQTLAYPTDLTPQDIMDTFTTVEVISFWEIRNFIKTLEETGFSTERLEVYYHSLLARPFFFAAMILLAAAVSLRPQRQGGTTFLVLSGVFIGFFIFFSDSALQAFGISQKIPVFLAAWTPTLVSILLGTSVILQLEDG